MVERYEMLLDAAPRDPSPPKPGASPNHSTLILTKDVKDRYVKRAGSEPIFRSAPFDNPIRQIRRYACGACIQSLPVLRSQFEKTGGLDESFRLGEDRDFMLRISFRIGFCYVSTPLVRHRLHCWSAATFRCLRFVRRPRSCVGRDAMQENVRSF